jgi:hypothetical protein
LGEGATTIVSSPFSTTGYSNFKVWNASSSTIYYKEGAGPEAYFSLNAASETAELNTTPYYFSENFSGDPTFLTISSICFPPFTLVKTDNGLQEICILKRGDLIKTENGLIPLTKNLITQTPIGAKYVKFPKDIFIKGVPKKDLYMTKEHAFSLGIKKDTEDVWNWLEACQFIGKLGIEEVHLDTKTYHNLIFDNQEEFSVEGMKVFSHHPNGNPYILPKEEYLGKVNEEERKIKAISYETFISDKPEEQDLGEYIAEKLKF